MALSTQRMASALLSISGVLALILAAARMYGVVRYAVPRRTHEIGIRTALAGDARCILRMLLRHGVSTVGIGLGLGLASALALTRMISGFLYGVPPCDPVTFCCTLLILAAVAPAACYVPAQSFAPGSAGGTEMQIVP
jgi:hypothetical protein